MKGVTFLNDKKRNKRFVQIDLDHLEAHQNELEDFLDMVIAESRKHDEEVSWDPVKKELKKEA